MLSLTIQQTLRSFCGPLARGLASAATSQPSAQKLERTRAPKTLTTYKKPFTPRKQYLFNEYDTQLANSPAVIVLQHYNLSGAELQELRRSLKQTAQNAHLMVVRAKMMRAVLRDTRYANLSSVFTGPSAVVYWDSTADGLAAMKLAIAAVQKQKKLIVMGAKFGDLLLNQKMMHGFVNLPSIDQLRAQVLGVVQAPAQQLTAVLARTPQRLVGVLAQMSDAKGQE
ncbi:hypothetical protein GGH19_001773 [Coemansia sp. RSA 1807]|nr:hypothetical protein LPJ62_001748 [Coemansia sp. RSA 2167]KAJ2576885.1 hypothetical protein GGH19_001773 [Coemansia sp. RSA 1807]